MSERIENIAWDAGSQEIFSIQQIRERLEGAQSKLGQEIEQKGYARFISLKDRLDVEVMEQLRG